MSAASDLFEVATEKTRFKEMPLARRMAPNSLEEFVGQEHIIGKGKLLRRAIEADRVQSIIFSGNPGVGKTALANVIAQQTNSQFVRLNAVHSKVADIREVVAKAKDDRAMYGKKTILFIDEIHRFSKTQQDALLPDVENGTVTLIGATTENPYFSVISSLISRSQVFEFKPLTKKDLYKVIDNALHSKRGLKEYKISLSEEAKKHLIDAAAGDARKVLNGLELAAYTTPPDSKGVINLSVDIIEESVQKKYVVYGDEEHYDIISAFIKSMRGSDPDAVLYWLGKMIYAGEDPRFIARRIVICASEDVGNADPQALIVSNAAMQAVAEIGMPEARIILAQAAVHVACAPKSNASYVGIDAALSDIKNGVDHPVPMHLKNAVYEGEKKEGKPSSAEATAGRGKGYKYAHSYPKGWVQQEYLPGGKKYYEPTDRGYEQKIQDWLKSLKK
ncbi:replication-associated recombination protein A [Candidatus Margulisiibacteriota bacterium]